MESHKVFEFSLLFSKKWPFVRTSTKTLVEYDNTWPITSDFPAPYTLDSYNIQCQDETFNTTAIHDVICENQGETKSTVVID